MLCEYFAYGYIVYIRYVCVSVVELLTVDLNANNQLLEALKTMPKSRLLFLGFYLPTPPAELSHLTNLLSCFIRNNNNNYNYNNNYIYNNNSNNNNSNSKSNIIRTLCIQYTGSGSQRHCQLRGK